MKHIPKALQPWIVGVGALLLGWLVRWNSGVQPSAQLLFDIPVDQVSEIVLEKAGKTHVLKRMGDAWIQTQPNEQPANPVAVRQLLVAMAEARVVQLSPLGSLPARAGLDKGAPSVEARWPMGSASLRVGKSHLAGLAWLGDIQHDVGGPGSIELHRLLVEGDPAQFRSARLFDRSGAESDRVSVQAGSGESNQGIELEKKDGRWFLVNPIQSRADNTAVADFLEAIARLEHGGVVDDAPGDLALFGLKQPAATISIRSLDVSKGVVSEEVLEIGGEGASGLGARFGKRRDRPGVFQLEKRAISTIFPPSAAFIDATMLGVDPAEVKSISFQDAQGRPTALLTRGLPRWQITLADPTATPSTTAVANTKPADMQRVREALGILCSARASDMAVEKIPASMVVAQITVALSSGAAIHLEVGKDSLGRWLVGDGGGLTRVYPATLALPTAPELLVESNR